MSTMSKLLGREHAADVPRRAFLIDQRRDVMFVETG